jgi:hypothetical protein
MKSLKKIFIILLLLTVILPICAGQRSYTVTIESIPQSINDFIKMRDNISKTPQGGVVMLLVALKMYELNKEEGYKALVVATDMARLHKGRSIRSYEGYSLGGNYPNMLNSVFSRFPYIASSYFPGTKPSDGYKMKQGPYNFTFTPHRYRPQNDEQHTLFVPCSGADSPRPVQVKKNNKGIWKAAEYSSILVGIRTAPSTAQDDNL